ncbi:MAG: TolC family protein [Victivallales bacterium]|nr:TolC family protein [Victivallales bacterium]
MNWIKRCGVLAACLVLASSCKTVERARQAQKPENRRPGERTVTAAELGLTATSVLSLRELEDIAVRYAPDAIRAQQALASAHIALKEAGADQLPTLNASLGHSRSTQNRSHHHQRSYTDGAYSGDLSLSWTIWDFDKTNLAVRRARENLRAAEQDLRNAQSRAIYQVRTAFFELNRCMELDKVAAQEEQQYKEHLEQVKAKADVGKSTSYDQTKAEVDWHNAVLAHVTTSHNVQNAWGDLYVSMGLAEAPSFQLGKGRMTDYELNLENLLKLAREKEPALAALHARAEAATIYVDRTIAELYPTLKLSLGAGVTSRNLAEFIWNLTGAATLTQTLYEGGSKMRRIEEAVVQMQTARTEVAAKEQELFQQLRKAVLVAKRAEKQLEVATITEKSAKLNLDIVNEQFRVGRASSIERTDAQVSHSEAQAAVVKAVYDRQDALAAIAHLTGDFELPGEPGKRFVEPPETK